MANIEVLQNNSKNKFYQELEVLKISFKEDKEMALKIEEMGSKIRCFYCLDLQIVYKDREGMFSNLDGRGDYDIINCLCCRKNSNWISCSSGPTSQYKGIVKRGNRERIWIEKKMHECGDSLIDKVKEKIVDV